MKHYLMVMVLLLTTTAQAQKMLGSWTGLLEAGPTKLTVVFNLKTDVAGKTVCLMDSPNQGVKGVPADLPYLSADSLSIALPRFGIKYDGKLKGDLLEGTFEQMGMKFPLVLKHETLVYHRPQHPVAPFPYTSEELKFTNESVNATLAGTLTYPVGYQKGHPVPVVLMVTGSGAQNRDEEIFEHKPFLVIADYLARHGIATLRYDDRAVGQSTGNYTENTKEVADDAEVGISFLRQMNAFSKVGILGHSEGATVGFMLGAKGVTDFVISMAGVGVKGDDCLYAQYKKNIELSGMPVTFNKKQFVESALAQSNPWLEYFLQYDPQSDIEQTACPVLAMNGSKDCQVISSQNLTAIERHLRKCGKTKVKEYPGLNHLFQECDTGSPLEYIHIEHTISQQVLEDIVEWIHSL